MISINAAAAYESTSTRPVRMLLFHPKGIPFHPFASLMPGPTLFFSEEEAWAVLFPDTDTKKVYETVSKEMDRDLLARIRAREVNPIRGWRIMKGIDQKELCRRTGIRQSNLSRMEQLGAVHNIRTLERIAKAMDIDSKELLP